MNRLVIDPVTRIEGHLRIEADVDEGGTVRDAWSSGTMVRGIEIILKGRDPRDAWAFAQRICGVCTLVHGIAAVRAVEDALGITVPANAQLIRNLMIAAQMVHDHVMHFYHLHALDWVDVTRALDADPAAAARLGQSLSDYPGNTVERMAAARQSLEAMVGSGQLGLFANAWWGHGAYRLAPEANLMALAHYLDALAWQRQVVQLHAIFGGKNPHPNLAVGGAPLAVSWAGSGRSVGTALDEHGLATVAAAIAAMQDFVTQVYLPDVLALGSVYRDWFFRGCGVQNFLCCGEFPGPGGLLVPSGVLLDGDLATVHPFDALMPDGITESTARSWYRASADPLHPFAGETELDYTGPAPPYEHLDVQGAYSWMKTPRWHGRPMEVGPLARVLMLHAHGQATGLVDDALTRLGLPMAALCSTMGRTVARALESKLFAEAMSSWQQQLVANITAGDVDTFDGRLFDPATWLQQAQGVGLTEAPRGALAHYVVIQQGRIANYQAVVPTTWNASPRDAAGQRSPYEAALAAGHDLLDRERPLEILRTIHSFDPCVACAVHVMGKRQEQDRNDTGWLQGESPLSG